MLRSGRCSERSRRAEVAQLVEHVTENHGVGSSILPLGTNLFIQFHRVFSRLYVFKIA